MEILSIIIQSITGLILVGLFIYQRNKLQALETYVRIFDPDKVKSFVELSAEATRLELTKQEQSATEDQISDWAADATVALLGAVLAMKADEREVFINEYLGDSPLKKFISDQLEKYNQEIAEDENHS